MAVVRQKRKDAALDHDMQATPEDADEAAEALAERVRVDDALGEDAPERHHVRAAGRRLGQQALARVRSARTLEEAGFLAQHLWATGRCTLLTTLFRAS